MTRVLLVGLGGGLGAIARYLLGLWLQTRLGAAFPWGTFLINVTGSFLIGLVVGLVAAGALTAEARLFLAVGVLGGYTTFSTFSYESLTLLTDGTIRAFLFNTLGQLAGGLLAAYLGLALSRALGGLR